jgi:hypothetical protein
VRGLGVYLYVAVCRRARRSGAWSRWLCGGG